MLCALFLLAAKQTVFAHNPPPVPPGPPKIIYVDTDSIGANDGSSWADAFNYLRDALATASPGDEIRVAEGTYKPNQGELYSGPGRGPRTPGEEGRSATFELKSGLTVKGGFAGFGAAEPNMWDPEVYQTILSGDLEDNDADADVNNPYDYFYEPTRRDNSVNVVTSTADDASAVLDGFIVTGAVNGGMVITAGSPTILNCVFSRNSASEGGAISIWQGQSLLKNCKFISNLGGGALFGRDVDLTLSECSFTGNYSGGAFILGSVVLTGCIFRNNSSHSGGGIVHSGGEFENGKLELTDCIFIDNSSVPFPNNRNGYGGAVWTTNATVRNCIFSGNWARRGGAIYGEVQSVENCMFTANTAEQGGCLAIGSSIITNCVFSGNRAEEGGVLYAAGSGSGPSLIGCTLSDNSAQNGNAISLSPGGRAPALLSMTISNCILWDGGSEINSWREDFADISIVYSNIQGGWSGEGNIDLDPSFADPGHWDPNDTADDTNDDFWLEGDYHLKSQAGRWDPISESWVIDNITSPCIDSGDPNSPVAFEPFPNGGRINLGAYGGTVEASKSPSGIHAKYGGGTGEPNNPYLIYTAEHMNTIGVEPNDQDKHFKLMADIDLSVYTGTDFNIIGISGYPFKGVFEGNGHTVSNFSYTSSSGYSIGLFRKISGQNAQIKDLGLIAPDIYVEEGSHVGSLVGQVSSGTITNCYVEGGSVLGRDEIGGLVGWNHGNINNCYSTCSVTGEDDIGGLVGINSSTTITNCSAGGEVFGRGCVGGLAGRNSGTIKNSSATGGVTGEERSSIGRENRYIGGLIGDNSGPLIGCSATGDVSGDTQVGGLVGYNGDSIINCYAKGGISGTEYIGGLVGLNSVSIINCYSSGDVSGTTYIGGLVGYKGFAATVLNSFWDIQASGQLISDGGISRSTVEMQTADTFLFAGWDFVGETENGTEGIWWILEGQDYPRLWWETTEELLFND